VVREDLVLRVVVDLAQTRERGRGVDRLVEREVELRDVEERERVGRVGLDELLRRGERVVRPLRRAVDLQQRAPRRIAVRIAVDRLPDVGDRLLRVAGGVGGVRQLDE
jgi:hypothetical protein